MAAYCCKAKAGMQAAMSSICKHEQRRTHYEMQTVMLSHGEHWEYSSGECSGYLDLRSHSF